MLEDVILNQIYTPWCYLNYVFFSESFATKFLNVGLSLEVEISHRFCHIINIFYPQKMEEVHVNQAGGITNIPLLIGPTKDHQAPNHLRNIWVSQVREISHFFCLSLSVRLKSEGSHTYYYIS